jgi:hypothetical protein
VSIFSLVHAGGRDTEREEAGVEAGKLRFDFGVVEKVGVDEFVEFFVVLTGWGADNGENLLHGIRGEPPGRPCRLLRRELRSSIHATAEDDAELKRAE